MIKTKHPYSILFIGYLPIVLSLFILFLYIKNMIIVEDIFKMLSTIILNDIVLIKLFFKKEDKNNESR